MEDNISIFQINSSERSKSWLFLIAILFVIIMIPKILLANSDPANLDQETEDVSNKADNEAKQQRWSFFPIISSSPEVGLMLGGMLFHFFPTESAYLQASTIDLYVFGTTNEQYSFTITPNIFLNQDEYRISAGLSANCWRANFYPIGNDSSDDKEQYDSTNYGINLTVERRFLKKLSVGPRVWYEKTDMNIKSGGMLDSGNIFGAKDGQYVGVGFSLGYDTRDNTNAPSQGALAAYQFNVYDKSLGSSLNFISHTLDVRYYFKTAFIKDSIVALSAKIQSTNGDVPFRYLPSPDGTFSLRGIESGRYKDNQCVSFQTEYRFPIKGKFSGTVFADFAQVAGEFNKMSLDATKTSLGCGIRYALNPKQRFNIRGDLAWVDGSIGIIINVREAF